MRSSEATLQNRPLNPAHWASCPCSPAVPLCLQWFCGGEKDEVIYDYRARLPPSDYARHSGCRKLPRTAPLTPKVCGHTRFSGSQLYLLLPMVIVVSDGPAEWRGFGDTIILQPSSTIVSVNRWCGFQCCIYVMGWPGTASQLILASR